MERFVIIFPLVSFVGLTVFNKHVRRFPLSENEISVVFLVTMKYVGPAIVVSCRSEILARLSLGGARARNGAWYRCVFDIGY